MRRVIQVAAMLAALLAPAPAPAEPPTMPFLDVTPCGGCTLRGGVIGAIKRAYVEAAEYEGYEIDEGRQAVLNIVEYVERDRRSASVFGPFAGRDYLRATLEWEGHQAVIEDSASSSFADMMVVAENIGLEAQKQVARWLAKPGVK